MKKIDKTTEKILLRFQRNEITEHLMYKRLAEKARGENKKILKKISDDELRHYNVWKKYTGAEVSPRRFQVFRHVLLSKIFGLTFALKLMERGESSAQHAYGVLGKLPETRRILEEENQHEEKLINMLHEEKLEYIGSMVLGLNDALVELTGALAGFTLALHNTLLIGTVGLITGIAAAMSMMSSEYLSKKSEGGSGKRPGKAALYTGIAYILAVLALVSPFFLFQNYYLSLAATVSIAIIIILLFTFFISVVKSISFRKRFLEMLLISLGIAALSFAIGFVLKAVLEI